jgi:hypothetical protein
MASQDPRIGSESGTVYPTENWKSHNLKFTHRTVVIESTSPFYSQIMMNPGFSNLLTSVFGAAAVKKDAPQVSRHEHVIYLI